MPVAVFCPTTPLLVEGMSGGPLDEVEALRAAVRATLKSLLATQPSSVTLVGVDASPAATGPVEWPASRHGSLAGFGMAVEPGPMPAGAGASVPDAWDGDDSGADDIVRGVASDERAGRSLNTGDVPETGGLEAAPATRDTPQAFDLPPSLAVGRWLLEDAGFTGDVRQWSVPMDATPRACASLGQRLGGRSLLLLGDASTCHGEDSPGGPHALAPVVDGLVVQALAAADVGELMALDVQLAASLGVSGRATWQVLAGWASRQVVDATVDCYDAPFGVGYVVGRWSVDPPSV